MKLNQAADFVRGEEISKISPYLLQKLMMQSHLLSFAFLSPNLDHHDVCDESESKGSDEHACDDLSKCSWDSKLPCQQMRIRADPTMMASSNGNEDSVGKAVRA